MSITGVDDGKRSAFFKNQLINSLLSIRFMYLNDLQEESTNDCFDF